MEHCLKTEVILLEFEEDECQIWFDTPVMECNTLTEGLVFVIEIVTLKKKEKMCAILLLTEVILHEFEEDECEIFFDTQVMECNTLTEGRVLIIEIVALKKKKEICEQKYAAHATYSTQVERMNLKKMWILPKKGTILHLMVRESKPIVVVL